MYNEIEIENKISYHIMGGPGAWIPFFNRTPPCVCVYRHQSNAFPMTKVSYRRAVKNITKNW